MSQGNKPLTNILASLVEAVLFGHLCLFFCWGLSPMSVFRCLPLSPCKHTTTQACSDYTPVCFVFVSYPSVAVALCSVWGLDLQSQFSAMSQMTGNKLWRRSEGMSFRNFAGVVGMSDWRVCKSARAYLCSVRAHRSWRMCSEWQWGDHVAYL